MERITWKVEDEPFDACVFGADPATPRPGVVVFHAWRGRTAFEERFAQDLTALGYVGIASDVYGVGRRGTTREENTALMSPLLADRARLERRLHGALEAARAVPGVDPERMAAVGFCFGGLCVLDLARSGADLRGVVAFHGLFTPREIPSQTPKAKVLALHGYADPMATPEQLVAFGNEMEALGADWQVHVFGRTMHAFTNPEANDPEFGTVYDARADARSRREMECFLEEIFATGAAA